jgi:proteasome beta subunit
LEKSPGATLEKVHPADGRTAVAFAGTVGLALDMTKLYQGELAHSEKMEGIPMTLSARAARLAAMIRQHLGQAVRGLAVAPLPAGYDPTAPTADAAGSSPYDAAGGLYEKTGFHAEGPGSSYARGALKELHRPGLSRRGVVLAALHALWDAAADDSVTGGPGPGRGIQPVVTVVTEAGFERHTEADTAELSRTMAERRRNRPDGPVATA